LKDFWYYFQKSAGKSKYYGNIGELKTTFKHIEALLNAKVVVEIYKGAKFRFLDNFKMRGLISNNKTNIKYRI